MQSGRTHPQKFTSTYIFSISPPQFFSNMINVLRIGNTHKKKKIKLWLRAICVGDEHYLYGRALLIYLFLSSTRNFTDAFVHSCHNNFFLFRLIFLENVINSSYFSNNQILGTSVYLRVYLTLHKVFLLVA